MTKSARDLLRLDRRELMAALGVALFAGPGCGRQPETPLPRLKGRAWVQGVYELHAQRYLDVQMGAETSSHGAYRVLAQKGVTALDGLQSREVPFHMRVDAASSRVQIERTVPERLTFTADMSVADRERATEAYHAARQHLHTDYYEIHRLDWAMSTLLGQLLAIHSAMEQAEIEQFKIVRDLAGLRGGGATPYQLPERVTRDDYVEVLVLLLARLEQDRARLASIEASIATVGLTARSTDAGSGSLTKNLHKVMLSVIHDAEATTPTPARFPASTKQARVAAGRELASQIEASTAYQEWKRAEDARALESAGMLFEAIDAVTHLPTSALFRTVIGIWRGEGDYLTYLQVLARIVPGGGLRDGRWVAARNDFFLAVRILSTVFRGKLLSAFENAIATKRIGDHCGGAATVMLLRQAAQKKWVVYCKRPFAGPAQVLAYLGRYTHRIAISNERIVGMDADEVTFAYKDRRDGDRRKELTLPAENFLRRFLLHVVPGGFVRIRHYGLLANSVRRERVALCRELLGVRADDLPEVPAETWEETLLRLTGKDVTRCPRCGGRVHTTRTVEPDRRPRRGERQTVPP